MCGELLAWCLDFDGLAQQPISTMGKLPVRRYNAHNIGGMPKRPASHLHRKTPQIWQICVVPIREKLYVRFYSYIEPAVARYVDII